MNLSDEELWNSVRERGLAQSRAHWSEFAAIVASVNIVIGLITAGGIATSDALPFKVQVMSFAMLAVSGVAVLLAYYSIQIGTVLSIGTLTFSQVFSSFVIAGAQACLFLYIDSAVTGSLKPSEGPSRQYWPVLGDWILILAAFAVFAAWASRLSAAREILGRPALAHLHQAAQAQVGDSRMAALTGCVLLVLWGLSFWLPPVWCLIAAMVIAVTAFTGGLVSQSHQARALFEAVAVHSSSTVSGAQRGQSRLSRLISLLILVIVVRATRRVEGKSQIEAPH